MPTRGYNRAGKTAQRANMSNWFPLLNYTHYSLLKGFSKPQELADKCKQNGYKACGIADYQSISGAVTFFKACRAAGVKPIIGCDFGKYILFAKNYNGWTDLIEAVSSLEAGVIPSEMAKKIFARKNLICISNQKFDKDSYKHCADLPRSYYANKEDKVLYKILGCVGFNTTMSKATSWYNSPKSGDMPGGLYNTFSDTTKHVFDKSESAGLSDEILQEIYDKCEDYDILHKPMLPKFDCPRGLSEEDYLKELCRVGWKKLLIDTGKVDDPEKKKLYKERFEEELGVIKDADLFGYFLIVQDIIRFVQDSGWLSGPGRGSAAGCLISYLIGVTQIDPLEYDLLFSRFYNAGRNTKDHVSLPDIDMDVPGKNRDDVIMYLKDKYGHDRVSQMLTFGRLQGRSAVKEVLRVFNACSFAEMNAITKKIPNEAEISDQLQEMDEEDRSIIRWTLINRPKDLNDFCRIREDGTLEGEYAEYFELAIRLEGTFKTQGKHAAGVVISANPLHEVCPMVRQRDLEAEKIAGLEMADLEALGHVKFDVLGITLLDKLMKIAELTNN